MISPVTRQLIWMDINLPLLGLLRYRKAAIVKIVSPNKTRQHSSPSLYSRKYIQIPRHLCRLAGKVCRLHAHTLVPSVAVCECVCEGTWACCTSLVAAAAVNDGIRNGCSGALSNCGAAALCSALLLHLGGFIATARFMIAAAHLWPRQAGEQRSMIGPPFFVTIRVRDTDALLA